LIRLIQHSAVFIYSVAQQASFLIGSGIPAQSNVIVSDRVAQIAGRIQHFHIGGYGIAGARLSAGVEGFYIVLIGPVGQVEIVITERCGIVDQDAVPVEVIAVEASEASGTGSGAPAEADVVAVHALDQIGGSIEQLKIDRYAVGGVGVSSVVSGCDIILIDAIGKAGVAIAELPCPGNLSPIPPNVISQQESGPASVSRGIPTEQHIVILEAIDQSRRPIEHFHRGVYRQRRI